MISKNDGYSTNSEGEAAWYGTRIVRQFLRVLKGKGVKYPNGELSPAKVVILTTDRRFHGPSGLAVYTNSNKYKLDIRK